MNNRAFTLIELLAVVAIIGILTVIAMPNWTQALVRSKIASAKANIHACAEALEAYNIDRNAFPPSRYYCLASGENKMRKYYELPMELTTPTAYLNQRPLDPFYTFTGASDEAQGQTIKYRSPGYGFFNNMPTEEGIWVPHSFPTDDGDYIFYNNASDENPASASPVQYGLWSVGPVIREEISMHMLEPVPAHTWYSPTNGIISSGIIVQLNTGHCAP